MAPCMVILLHGRFVAINFMGLMAAIVAGVLLGWLIGCMIYMTLCV